MTNQIRTIDLIAYFRARVARFTEIIEREEKRYAEEKEKHEKTFWFRWLKQEYSRTFKGSCDMYSLNWDTLNFSRMGHKEAVAILKQLAYRKKCGFETTVWDFGYGWYDTAFYEWCAENNIPY